MHGAIFLDIDIGAGFGLDSLNVLVINDLMDISELAHHGPEDIFIATITLIGSCILMIISVDPWLTLIIFSVVPFIIFYAIFTRKGMRNAFTKMGEWD